jgi:molybdate transport system substrate-binding protein
MQRVWTCVLMMSLGWGPVLAAEVSVAVAANFTAPMQRIAQMFEQDTQHKAVLSVGSTGNFYAQIKHGAPFDVLLAADDETPAKLEKEGLGVVGSRMTYAVGKLVLWSKRPGWVDDKGEVLRSGQFQRLAVANPKLAPYGAAAWEVLGRWDLVQALTPKLVQGDNIAQTYQFVFTENAQLGFVALSQVWRDGRMVQGSGWVVPPHLYSPIRQDAVLLNKGRHSQAAQALLAYLRSDKAKEVIRAYGYDL